MKSLIAVAPMLPMRGLRLGPLRLTPYGACAAVGLLLAMTLASRAARRVGLSSEAAWDAGFFAIISCLIASRLLLVVSDPFAFAHYPLLVLSLPSLTITGMALAAAMVWTYLRRRNLPLLSTLDTFAAPTALFAAFLELGHWLDASEVGIPTGLSWGVRDPFAPAGARLHPVTLYGVTVALLLAALLSYLLPRVRRRGLATALGLLLGGLGAFGLDMLTSPSVLFADLLLEPGQFVALGAMLSGALLWTLLPHLTAGEGTCQVGGSETSVAGHTLLLEDPEPHKSSSAAQPVLEPAQEAR